MAGPAGTANRLAIFIVALVILFFVADHSVLHFDAGLALARRGPASIRVLAFRRRRRNAIFG